MTNKWLCNSISELDDFKVISYDSYNISYTNAYNLCFELSDSVNLLCSYGEVLVDRMNALQDVIKTSDFDEELETSTYALGTMIAFYKTNITEIIASVAARLDAATITDEWFATTASMYSKNIYNSLLNNVSDAVGDFVGTFLNFGTGVFEGVFTVGENLLDTAITIGTLIATPFTYLTDIITNGDSTDEMWNAVNDFVKTDYVGDAFDDFYDNTAYGNWFKENCLCDYETVRNAGKVTGEILTSTSLSMLTAANPEVLSLLGENSLAATMGIVNFSTGVGKNYQYDLNNTDLNRPYHAISDASIDGFFGVLSGELIGETNGVFNLAVNSGTGITSESVKNFGVKLAKDSGVVAGTSVLSSVSKAYNDTANGIGGSVEENFKNRVGSDLVTSGTSILISNDGIGGNDVTQEIVNGLTNYGTNEIINND